MCNKTSEKIDSKKKSGINFYSPPPRLLVHTASTSRTHPLSQASHRNNLQERGDYLFQSKAPTHTSLHGDNSDEKMFKSYSERPTC